MMRKILFPSLLLFLFSSFSIKAQDVFLPELSFGVNAGMTISHINFNPKVSQGNLSQFEGGLSFRYITEKHFGLLGELNISQRGWKEEKDSIPDHRYTKSLLYAELPLMTHIYFNLGSRMRLLFNLGPQIGYLLSERVLDENVILDPGTENDPPIQYTTPIQHKFDWGIVVGGGVEFRTGLGQFIAEARYYYGLSDIYKNGTSEYFSTSSNQVINLKLTYFYRR